MEKKNPLLVKKHWHLIVWEVPAVGLPQKISTYSATRKRLASIPEIRAAQQERQVPQGAVLVNVGYLGFGTQYDLTGESPVKPPSKVSEDFLAGMEAGLHYTGPPEPINPFSDEQGDGYRAQEWQLGYANGLRFRKKP